jgi:hypothetical protein
MAVKTFKMDQGVVDALDMLKKRFNVSTDAAVIERALGLAQVATKVGGDDGIVTLDGSGGRQQIALGQ